MGLTLEFYLGNPRKITKAMCNHNFDLLYEDSNVVYQIADLSLHLSPKDLNLLSRQFGIHSQQSPIDLRPHLKVLIDEQDYGLLLVDSKWVKYAAKVSSDNLEIIVSGWFESLRQEYPNEEISITEEAKEAVQDLLELCKKATQKKRAEVLHGWFL